MVPVLHLPHHHSCTQPESYPHTLTVSICRIPNSKSFFRRPGNFGIFFCCLYSVFLTTLPFSDGIIKNIFISLSIAGYRAIRYIFSVVTHVCNKKGGENHFSHVICGYEKLLTTMITLSMIPHSPTLNVKFVTRRLYNEIPNHILFFCCIM